MRLLFPFLILTAAALWYRSCENQQHVRIESAAVTPKLKLEETHPAMAKPSPSAQKLPVKEEPEENPYQTDPFTKRKLSLPMPKSVTELLAKMNSYEMPRLPALIPGRPVDSDGSVLAHFSGFCEGLDGNLRKILMTRVVGRGERIEIKLEDKGNDYHEWSTDRGELTVNNFDDDRYSLVIGLPDGRLFYFKFFDNQNVSGYEGTHFRVLKGWLLSKASPTAQPLRVALIDHWDQAEWPNVDAIRILFPAGVLPQ